MLCEFSWESLNKCLFILDAALLREASALLMDHMGTTWLDQFSTRLLDALLFCSLYSLAVLLFLWISKQGISFSLGGRILSFLDISSVGCMEASSKLAVLPRSLLVYILGWIHMHEPHMCARVCVLAFVHAYVGQATFGFILYVHPTIY